MHPLPTIDGAAVFDLIALGAWLAAVTAVAAWGAWSVLVARRNLGRLRAVIGAATVVFAALMLVAFALAIPAQREPQVARCPPSGCRTEPPVTTPPSAKPTPSPTASSTPSPSARRTGSPTPSASPSRIPPSFSPAPPPPPRPPAPTPRPSVHDYSIVLAAAGDIAGAGSGDSATGALLRRISPALVLVLGDLCYDTATSACFARYYDPTWGAFKSRTRPAVGNHDYQGGQSGYRSYWGFGGSGPLYYSYNLAGWHLIALDSEAAHGPGSAQVAWLKADLAANRSACTLAYWHKPRFSSGSTHGSDASYEPFWSALYAANAELVLSGHDHDYERFAPQAPGGVRDPARGLRQFVVGTGGRSYYQIGGALPNSEVRNSGTFGVLQLTLHANSYDFRFVPEAGKGFTDVGSGMCH